MHAGSADERWLEFKVGALVLGALAILLVFLFLVADIDFRAKRTIDVYFHNPGGLSAGVAVKVAGRKVGRIEEMTFLGQSGPKNPATGKPSLVRARLRIDESVYKSLREDVRFYITSKGVLGDPFLEIDPGYGAKPLNPDETLFGIDPPRLDLFLADAAQLVQSLNRLLITNEENIDKLLSGSANLVTAVTTLVGDTDSDNAYVARFETLAGKAEQLLDDTRILVVEARDKYVNNPEVDRIVRNLRIVSSQLSEDLDPLMAETRETMRSLDALADAIGPKERAAIQQSLHRLSAVSQRADRLLGRIEAVVRRMESGHGTVGQLLQDEEIYDDLKELIRDIKRHPWKLIWED